jgi:hypothetical protein
MRRISLMVGVSDLVFVLINESGTAVTSIPVFTCVTPFVSKTFSTRRDLVFTMATERDRWYDMTLLSVRTSGCRARVILTTDRHHVFSSHFDCVIQLTWTEAWRHPTPAAYRGAREGTLKQDKIASATVPPREDPGLVIPREFVQQYSTFV